MLAAYAKRMFRALGVEVQRVKSASTVEAILRNLLVHQCHPAVLLDVGANSGQFAREARIAGFKGRIVSFEPLRELHAELSRRAAGDSRWLIAPCVALGSEKSVMQMNVAQNSGASSSLLAMHPTHLQAAPESAYVGTQDVQVERLDALCQRLLKGSDDLYLKIDTQGYERQVLLGATDILERVAVLQLELSLVPLYEGAPLLAEMVQFAESLGFELFNIAPGFGNRQTGRLLQVDAFFVRKAQI